MSAPSWRELKRWGRRTRPLALRATAFPAVLAALAACSTGWHIGSNSQVSDPGTVDSPVFYVKRQVPVDMNGALVQDDLRIMRTLTPSTPSADLFMRASASPAAAETNITARITAGQMWDVKDVDTSADGKLVIFAMRGPLTQNQKTKDPPSWRIYEYVIATDTLHPVINPAIDPDPVQELPTGGSHGSEAGRKLGFGIQLAQLAAKEVTDFKNRLDAVRGHFHLLWSVEHAAVFQERNHPASGAYFKIG